MRISSKKLVDFVGGHIGDFFGYRAAAAKRPPEKLFERLQGASFFPAA
jgi:hypothetical protein